MKRKHFTESQIVSALKKHESGMLVKDIARELGISDATFYNWKARYGGMEASDVKRSKTWKQSMQNSRRCSQSYA